MMNLKKQSYWHTPLSADHKWNTHRPFRIHLRNNCSTNLTWFKTVPFDFFCKLKGRDSVTEALEKLDVQKLGVRRKTSRRSLLLRLLFSEENHGQLIDSYDQLMTTKTSIPVTWTAERTILSPSMPKVLCIATASCQNLSENSRLTFLSSSTC